jgi:hypothetical protein
MEQTMNKKNKNLKVDQTRGLGAIESNGQEI